jgi:hypothetical protein
MLCEAPAVAEGVGDLTVPLAPKGVMERLPQVPGSDQAGRAATVLATFRSLSPPPVRCSHRIEGTA